MVRAGEGRGSSQWVHRVGVGSGVGGGGGGVRRVAGGVPQIGAFYEATIFPYFFDESPLGGSLFDAPRVLLRLVSLIHLSALSRVGASNGASFWRRTPIVHPCSNATQPALRCVGAVIGALEITDPNATAMGLAVGSSGPIEEMKRGGKKKERKKDRRRRQLEDEETRTDTQTRSADTAMPAPTQPCPHRHSHARTDTAMPPPTQPCTHREHIFRLLSPGLPVFFPQLSQLDPRTREAVLSRARSARLAARAPRRPSSPV